MEELLDTLIHYKRLKNGKIQKLRYTKEFKTDVIKLISDGTTTIDEVVLKCDIDRETIIQWLRQ